MPLISYETKRFSKDRLATIAAANVIIAEYGAANISLTLRSLYYQFVSRDLIANRQTEYKRLGSIISEGRRCGMIDWDAINDRTRNLERLPSWDSPESIVAAVADQFKYDRWETQPNYVEVWFEKDALEGVFEGVCNEFRVPYFSCRGYTSDSAVWAAAQRLADKSNDGKDVVILHFGDHDPSGIDMSRDIEDRLQLFEAGDVDLRRLALNMNQITKYKPPPNPAKVTDSRFAGYEALYGKSSWELDALDPKVLATLVRKEVQSLIDDDEWDEAVEKEQKARTQLTAISNNYAKVVKRLKA